MNGNGTHVSAVNLLATAMDESNSWKRDNQLFALRQRGLASDERKAVLTHLAKSEYPRFMELDVLQWVEPNTYRREVLADLAQQRRTQPANTDFAWISLTNMLVERKRRFAPDPKDISWIIQMLGQVLDTPDPERSALGPNSRWSTIQGLVGHLMTLPLTRGQAKTVIELAGRSVAEAGGGRSIDELLHLRFGIPYSTYSRLEQIPRWQVPQEKVRLARRVQRKAVKNIHLAEDGRCEPFRRYQREVTRRARMRQEFIDFDRGWLDVIEPERSQLIRDLKASANLNGRVEILRSLGVEDTTEAK